MISPLVTKILNRHESFLICDIFLFWYIPLIAFNCFMCYVIKFQTNSRRLECWEVRISLCLSCRSGVTLYLCSVRNSFEIFYKWSQSPGEELLFKLIYVQHCTFIKLRAIQKDCNLRHLPIKLHTNFTLSCNWILYLVVMEFGHVTSKTPQLQLNLRPTGCFLYI